VPFIAFQPVINQAAPYTGTFLKEPDGRTEQRHAASAARIAGNHPQYVQPLLNRALPGASPF
jgi:hypothetical protein